MKVVVEMDLSRCVDFSSLISDPNNSLEYRLELCIGLGQEDEKSNKEKDTAKSSKSKWEKWRFARFSGQPAMRVAGQRNQKSQNTEPNKQSTADGSTVDKSKACGRQRVKPDDITIAAAMNE